MKKEEKAPPSPIDLLSGEEKKEPKKSGKKHKHKITHIESHTHGGHTVRHSPGTPEEVSYSAPDLDAVHDGLEEHLGEPNQEEAAEAGEGAPGA